MEHRPAHISTPAIVLQVRGSLRPRGQHVSRQRPGQPRDEAVPPQRCRFRALPNGKAEASASVQGLRSRAWVEWSPELVQTT